MLFDVKRPDLGEGICYSVWDCPSCTFKFAQGPLQPSLLSRLYNGGFHGSSQQAAPVGDNGEFTPESMKFPIIRNVIDRTRSLQRLRSSGDLLDVGAGRGYFVKAASQVFSAEGIELNPDAAEFGRSMGVHVVSGDFLTHDFREKQYDIITMWDVIASLPEPKTAVARIQGLLKQDGLLVMTLPDGGSAAARLLKRYWPLMIPPVNLGFYTRKSVQHLLASGGFRVQEIRHDAKQVSIDFLLRKLMKTAGFANRAQTQLPFSPSFSIPLNLGDIMTVVAVRDSAR
ncbi:MAG: class I SAM-dependent methyltransferase [Nitrospiraceae bacterium]|nr:MAG: class I SAM-dependent methyltransferase [Nitrospiraceae bacterium]